MVVTGVSATACYGGYRGQRYRLLWWLQWSALPPVMVVTVVSATACYGGYRGQRYRMLWWLQWSVLPPVMVVTVVSATSCYAVSISFFSLFLVCTLALSFLVAGLSAKTKGHLSFCPCDEGNESGFRPPLCTYRLIWARRTS